MIGTGVIRETTDPLFWILLTYHLSVVKGLTYKNYILCYETAHNEEAPELFYDFVTTRINITVDMRTIKSRSHLQSLENEVRRLIHTKRKGDGTNFDRLVFKTRTDLSDRSKKLFRMTFQIEVVILAEQIP